MFYYICFFQRFSDCIDSNICRLFFRVTVYSSTDIRESDTFDTIFLRKQKTFPVTRSKQFRLSFITAIPNRTHSMYHIFRRQSSRSGDYRITCRTRRIRAAALRDFYTFYVIDCSIVVIPKFFLIFSYPSLKTLTIPLPNDIECVPIKLS